MTTQPQDWEELDTLISDISAQNRPAFPPFTQGQAAAYAEFSTYLVPRGTFGNDAARDVRRIYPDAYFNVQQAQVNVPDISKNADENFHNPDGSWKRTDFTEKEWFEVAAIITQELDAVAKIRLHFELEDEKFDDQRSIKQAIVNKVEAEFSAETDPTIQPPFDYLTLIFTVLGTTVAIALPPMIAATPALGALSKTALDSLKGGIKSSVGITKTAVKLAQDGNKLPEEWSQQKPFDATSHEIWEGLVNDFIATSRAMEVLRATILGNQELIMAADHLINQEIQQRLASGMSSADWNYYRSQALYYAFELQLFKMLMPTKFVIMWANDPGHNGHGRTPTSLKFLNKREGVPVNAMFQRIKKTENSVGELAFLIKRKVYTDTTIIGSPFRSGPWPRDNFPSNSILDTIFGSGPGSFAANKADFFDSRHLISSELRPYRGAHFYAGLQGVKNPTKGNGKTLSWHH